MVETERGCGWRKIGGVYLVCDGALVSCDALPIELVPCQCCEFVVNQARSIQPIHAGYLASLLHGHKCKDEFECPVCWFGNGYQDLKAEIARIKKDLAKPWERQTTEDRETREEKLDLLRKLEAAKPESFYLMFVSKDYYTPESFIKEANKQGVSKRVAPNSVPKGFRVGKDWIFLAHGEVAFPEFSDKDPPIVAAPDGEFVDGPREVTVRRASGIFYAFKPERLEVILWKGTDNQLIADYEEAGYVVVLIEKTKENIERHGDGNPPPLPYGFKRKDKKPLAEDSFNNAKKGSRHRGLYRSEGSGSTAPKPEDFANTPRGTPVRGANESVKTATSPKAKKTKRIQVEEPEESTPGGQWSKGEL